MRQDFTVKFKWTRELMDIRKQEKIFFSVKDYLKAEEFKRRGDRMEEEERINS